MAEAFATAGVDRPFSEPHVPVHSSADPGTRAGVTAPSRDNRFVIGTTSRIAGRKLVTNIKYTKMELAAGALEQFVTTKTE